MSNELVVGENYQLTAQAVRANVNLIQEVVKAVMIGPSPEHPEGIHYGVIPGTNKKSLYKAGAEVLGVTFRIAISYRIEDLSGKGFSRYRVAAVGTHQVSGLTLGEGMGACSSLEEKYKWRKASSNSEFEATPEQMRRIKYGYNKSERKEYEIKQVRTEAADLDNTILKMACKRAGNAMIINVTAASDIFTQEVEDLPEGLLDADKETGEIKQPVKMPQAKSEENFGTSAVASDEYKDAQNKLNADARKAVDVASTATEMAEPGEVMFIEKKLAALKVTDPDVVLSSVGVISLDGLTKENFAKIKDALKGKK